MSTDERPYAKGKWREYRDRQILAKSQARWADELARKAPIEGQGELPLVPPPEHGQ